jgi:hypothetical protein
MLLLQMFLLFNGRLLCLSNMLLFFIVFVLGKAPGHLRVMFEMARECKRNAHLVGTPNWSIPLAVWDSDTFDQHLVQGETSYYSRKGKSAD